MEGFLRYEFWGLIFGATYFLNFTIYLFRSYSFGIETINKFIRSRTPSKTIPVFRPKGPKTQPFGPAHTYMAYIREYPHPQGVDKAQVKGKSSFEKKKEK